MAGSKSMFTTQVMCVFLVVCGFVCPGRAGAGTVDAEAELYKQVELFSDAVTTVQSDYKKEVEPKQLVYGALEGMLSSLDGYSQFMDPESLKELEVETKGEFGGLGLEIGIRDDILTVVAPLYGTPAERAGLKAGDKIVRIDGESTQDIKLTDAVKKLRGKPGSKIALTVLREGEEKLLDFSIERSIIKLESISEARLIDGGIGYVRLTEFQEKTPRQLDAKLKELKNAGMEALILDLRNNPGGLLNVSFKVSERFLPRDAVVVSLKSRLPEQNKVYKSRGKNKLLDMPMVVIVDGGSASASEIVAGALQDNRRAIILGAKTFGKGSVQTIIPLRDGSALRLTTAGYYTPNGHSISDKGIIPDVPVDFKPEPEQKTEKKEDGVFSKIEKKTKPDAKNEKIYDNQLRAAVDVLKGILFYSGNEDNN